MKAGATAARNHEVYRVDGELWVTLKDRVVLEDVETLKKSIAPAIVRGVEHVYLDLQKVELLDSAGLGLLAGFKMTAKMHGANIALVDPNKHVKDLLSTSKLNDLFENLSGDGAEAVRSRLAKPKNLRLNGSGSSEQAPPSEVPFDGEHFPQVTSEGSFEDAKSEGTQVQELVEEQCRNAVESMRQGDYENSIEAYKKALALDPNYLPALNNLAIVYEKQPVWRPLAIEAWNRVLELSRQRNDEKHRNRAERHLADLAE